MAPQCIVIGASAGGVRAIRQIVSLLPAGFTVPVYVVVHVPPYQPSVLPELLDRAGPLHASHPEDHTRVQPGNVYVAPPDRHLLINDGYVDVKRGPKENGFRPSIDALFRSAAYSYGPRAVGVVLSGALNDGTSGLWSIKRLGGVAIVQEPRDAAYPSMPRSAMEYTDPDFRLTPAEIGALLTRLAGEPAQAHELPAGTEEDARRMAIETQIAAGVDVPDQIIMKLGELTPYTCPECLGTLVRITEGTTLRFRCHTGHGFTADALLEGMTDSLENRIWQVVRNFQEAALLLEHMAQHYQEHGDAATGQRFLEKSRQMGREASELKQVAARHGALSEENLGQSPPPAGTNHETGPAR